MANTYKPERWVVVKMMTNDPHYRVFGYWSGSYIEGESWRINSGITKVEDAGKNYKFYGSTGSVYVCGKEFYGMKMYGSAILRDMKSQLNKINYDLEILHHETDFLGIEYDLAKVSDESTDK